NPGCGGNPGDGGGGNPGGGSNPGDGGGGNPGDGGGGNPLPNQPPTVEAIADQDVNEGDTLTITVTASDPDGDPLTFSGTGLQSFMALDSATGVLTVTPGATDSGTYPITITVGDGKGGLATVSFEIRVINVNIAPAISPIGAQTLSEGEILSLTITASDGDFDPITLTATGLASFMTFVDNGGGNATFTAAPNYTHSGTYDVTVTATDSHGAASSETFTVTVVDTNPRVTQGLIGLWWFTGFSGQNFDKRDVPDTSGFGAPLTLRIRHLGAGGDSTKATSDGGLNINKPIKIESTANATKIVDAIKASNAFTVELWLRSRSASNSGPGRIVTISQDTSNQRNLTIAQGGCNGSNGSRYCLRLRTTNASGYSQTDNNTPLTSTDLQHFVMTYSSSDSRVRVYINGSLVYNQQISGATGALSGWNNAYRLLLANEYGADSNTRAERDWTGDLYLLAFYNRALSAAEISQNYAAGHLPQQQ
ncbi:MAG: Ig-like domain-containing protein, partial [Aggregatilineales bacterium]